jgi:hypothetical protein
VRPRGVCCSVFLHADFNLSSRLDGRASLTLAHPNLPERKPP